jgi:hypothetical protein
VWALLTDIESMGSFAGYGPIPGIARARWIEGNSYREGAVREVENRDGSRHREDIMAARAPDLLEDRIYGFTSPLRFVVREAHERFELEATAEGTALRRTLALELLSPLCYPLATLLVPLLRRAIRRHHAALAQSLERRT